VGYQLTPDGTGAAIVTEMFGRSRWPAERVGIEDGRIWIEVMTKTLARLDEVCTEHAPASHVADSPLADDLADRLLRGQ
jgi:hypothetical protein